jgi:uncharacterized protein with GYD domain
MLGPCPHPHARGEEEAMARFISLINWTDQGAKDAAGTVERADAAKKVAADMGGSLEVYWTMGQYDIVAISEFPDDETAVGFLAKISTLGNIRTATMRAFDSSEVNAIMAKG